MLHLIELDRIRGHSFLQNQIRYDLAKICIPCPFTETVDGPMCGDLNLQEQAKGEKFAKKADAVYEKAVNSSKAIFAKTKLSTLISEGKR